MMQMIQSFFEAIGGFFTKVWDILTFVFNEITTFFKMLSPVLKFFQSLLSSIPPLFYAFGIAMLVVLILYVILGRNAGGD